MKDNNPVIELRNQQTENSIKKFLSLNNLMTPKVLVGHDASGLELRMLAHYLNDPVYTKVITEEDPHTYHQELLRLSDRDQAKAFIYKFNYGAGGILIGLSVYSYGELIGNFTAKQIASAMKTLHKRANKFGMVGIGKGTFVPVSEEIAVFMLAGDALKKTFLRNNPGLESLIERVKEAGKRGWLLGLDGRRIYLRRDLTGRVQVHKALNTLMQSAGSVVMKHSIVLLDQYIREERLSSIKLYDMHDEAGFECLPEEADKHAELAVKSVVQAGISLGLNCPLDAEALIGKTWADVH